MTASTSPSVTKSSPTTFVQADTATFRDLVQKLTGSTSQHHTNTTSTTTSPPPTGPRRSQFKLQERRQLSTKKLEIIMKSLNSLHHNNSLISQHSPMDVSPVTPPVTELSLAGPGSGMESPLSEEEKGVSEKGFYVNQYSPVNTSRGSETPELLPLFPLTSPRI